MRCIIVPGTVDESLVADMPSVYKLADLAYQRFFVIVDTVRSADVCDPFLQLQFLLRIVPIGREF